MLTKTQAALLDLQTSPEKEYQELIGKICKVKKLDDELLVFEANDGFNYIFYHNQDCCETVSINDIIGDLKDLENSPILMAESVSHRSDDNDDSETWTFYKYATIKGYVTVRWLGVSNGYYSEKVDFKKEKRDEL